MSRKTRGEEDIERIKSDGTAARTRPLSIQDIMLRREKKAASEAKKTKEGPQENDKGTSDHLEQGTGYKNRKDPSDMPVDRSRKEKNRETTREGSKKGNPRHTPREGPKKDDIRYTPKEVPKKDNSEHRPKDGSKIHDLKDKSKVSEKEDPREARKNSSKKEGSSIKDGDQLVDRDKAICSTHNKLGKSMSGRADESKDANPGDMRARNGNAKWSQKGSGKRWNDETVDDDNRTKDRTEKLRNETKRKGRSFDDEKSSKIDRPTLKRHDSARFQDSKHPDKIDGRKEYAKPYHGEPRMKRRRSRSRDLDRERHGRSVSPPPREQRLSHRGHDYGNYPPYYSTEKSRRKYDETDKQRVSENGGYSGGSYRKYESRLGGYSPRKKKTAPQAEQATTKTPSPAVKSPEKKSATWDQLPVRTDQYNFLTTLHPAVGQPAPPIQANFSALKKDHAVKVETILARNNLAADSVQLTQATRPLRRLHIENLPDSTTEDILVNYLNDFLLSSGAKQIQQSKPCLSCTINKKKRQAFVEFLTPEDATEALSFDGRSLNGSALKIRRPKEYVEMTNVAPKKPAEETKLISDIVADSPHKIFIAGISGVISSEMLVEIVSAFGPLAAYRFLFNEELGGPCAFLEYLDHSITSKACAGLNGMKLGGRTLTAVHVFPNPPSQVGNEASPFYGIPDNAKSLLEEPTKVLQLKNLFDQEEYMLLSKSELEETLDDVRLECARFGAVKSVNVVEYPAGSDNTAEANIVEPKSKVKTEPIEFRDNDNRTEAGPNDSIDEPNHSEPTEKEDVYPIPGGLDEKDKHLPSIALCEGHEPAADLDGMQAVAAIPALQHVEADHKVSEADADEDKHLEAAAAAATAQVGVDAVEKGHADTRTSEICSSATLGGKAVGDSGRENELQSADDASEELLEESHHVESKDEAFVFEPGSVLVEFTREEAACMAAHSLHGRCFGNRIVHAGYAPHDLYLQRYPR